MNRDELVEKAARAMHERALEVDADYALWGDLSESVREQYRDQARVAVGVILPDEDEADR
jgi:hypothetical protein